MSKLINIASVSVSGFGKLPLAEKPGTFTPSGIKREHKAGRLPSDGGYTEMATAAKLELNLNLLGGLDVARLNTVDSADVTVRLSDGHVHLLSQAHVAEPVAIGDDGAGKVTIVANISEQIS